MRTRGREAQTCGRLRSASGTDTVCVWTGASGSASGELQLDRTRASGGEERRAGKGLGGLRSGSIWDIAMFKLQCNLGSLYRVPLPVRSRHPRSRSTLERYSELQEPTRPIDMPQCVMDMVLVPAVQSVLQFQMQIQCVDRSPRGTRPSSQRYLRGVECYFALRL